MGGELTQAGAEVEDPSHGAHGLLLTGEGAAASLEKRKTELTGKVGASAKARALSEGTGEPDFGLDALLDFLRRSPLPYRAPEAIAYDPEGQSLHRRRG